jgi:NAD(P)-dependent dehydrogenase (short-subunit alcohol dehydrogenase family)
MLSSNTKGFLALFKKDSQEKSLMKGKKMSKPAIPVFVVTGGAGGMGRSCARQLGPHGMLLLTDVVAASLEQTAQDLRAEGFHVETLCTDISNEEAVRALAEQTRTLGTLRGIAHTAGLSPTMANWQRIIQVDLVGTARLLHAFLPLAESDTAVVCIASMAGHLVGASPAASYPGLDGVLDEPLHEGLLKRLEPAITMAPSQEEQSSTAYGLAKYGVIRLCRHEAAAWGARGARLVSLSPGIIQTPMGQQEFDQQAAMRTLLAQTPLKRQGTPEEIAHAVDFLLSTNASFITGCDLLVDGGVTEVMKSSLAQIMQRGRTQQEA